MPTGRLSLAEAQAYCASLAKSHYENFTVGSLLFPSKLKPHLFTLYAFCRFVDDLGDESEGNRLEALRLFENELLSALNGVPSSSSTLPQAAPILLALAHTAKTFGIEREPLLKLIEANRRDQVKTRYATFAELLDYCDHSANPCGELVLYLLRAHSPQRKALSDYTCTALQLTNFWQDILKDLSVGRVYLPQEDLKRFHYTEEELKEKRYNEQFIQLMAFEVERTRSLFRRGLPLAFQFKGRAKLDLLLFTLGGWSILNALEKERYNIFQKRPTLSPFGKFSLFGSTALKCALHLPVSLSVRRQSAGKTHAQTGTQTGL